MTGPSPLLLLSIWLVLKVPLDDKCWRCSIGVPYLELIYWNSTGTLLSFLHSPSAAGDNWGVGTLMGLSSDLAFLDLLNSAEIWWCSSRLDLSPTGTRRPAVKCTSGTLSFRWAQDTEGGSLSCLLWPLLDPDLIAYRWFRPNLNRTCWSSSYKEARLY